MLNTLKLDESLNKDIKVALFGTNKVKEDLYDFLRTTYKLTSELAKPFVESNKVVMGYGLQPESIPDICHFGKNIILLKKLYYNNILSVKNKKMHAIEYFTNVKVSDNFVDVILQMCKNSKPNTNDLTQDEKQLLDTLLHVCGIKSSANSSKKDDVVHELKNKFKLIYFDEFQVTNIVDAMILGNLFKKIFKIKNNNTNKQLIESRIISLNDSICRMTNL